MLERTPPRRLSLHANPLAGPQDATLSSGPTDAFLANFRRYSAAETRYLRGRQTAEELVGPITPGMCRLVITIGWTDLSTVLIHIAEKIGPCDLVISTWDVAMGHLNLIRTARDTGAVIRVRWVLDSGFVKRDAPIYATLLAMFGRDNVREWRNHAKVLLLGNDRFKVCVFTSANLGSNPRQEHYTIVEEPAVYEKLLDQWIDPAFAMGVADDQVATQGRRSAPAARRHHARAIRRPAGGGLSPSPGWHGAMDHARGPSQPASPRIWRSHARRVASRPGDRVDLRG